MYAVEIDIILKYSHVFLMFYFDIAADKAKTPLLKQPCNYIVFFFSSLVWTIMLCVSHTNPTPNNLVGSLLSGWTTTTGRLLGAPK